MNLTKTLSTTLRLLGRLHCGALAAILFAVAYSLLGLVVPLSLSPAMAFWRGWLFAVPTALCYYAIKRLPAMWQFLLASAGLCALSWLLAGHPGGAALMALMCLFRARARLAEEDEGPTVSFFDRPVLPVVAVFVAAYLLSAVLGIPVLQRLSLLGGVLYLLIWMTFQGIERIDDYLRLNRDMSGLPARRIGKIAGAAALGCVTLTALLLIPGALTDPGSTRIQLPERHLDPSAAIVQPETVDSDMSGQQDMAEGLAEVFGGPSWRIPDWVSNLFLAIVGVLLLLALAAGIRELLKNFRRSYSDSRDIIQRLDREDQDQAKRLDPELRRPRLWDRSPGANIRRRYRRAILKGTKETPKAWHTPAELEQAAGVADAALHEDYERVRYGQPGL